MSSYEIADLFLKLDALNYYSVAPQSSDKALRHRWGLDTNPATWTLYGNGERRIPEDVLRKLTAAAVKHLPGQPEPLNADVDGVPLLNAPFPEFWRILDATVAGMAGGTALANARRRTWEALRGFLAGNDSTAAVSDIRLPADAERWIDALTSPDVQASRPVLPARGSFTLILPALVKGPHLLWLYEVRDLGERVTKGGPPGIELLRWARSPMAVDALVTNAGFAITLHGIRIGEEADDFILRAIAMPVEQPARFDPNAAAGPRRMGFPETAKILQRLRRELAGRNANAVEPAQLITVASLNYSVR